MSHANNNHRHLATAILRDLRAEAEANWEDDGIIYEADNTFFPSDKFKLTAGRGMPGETRTHRAALGHVDFIGTWMEADFTFAEALAMPEEEVLAKLKSLIADGIQCDIETEAEQAAMNQMRQAAIG